MAKRKLPGIDLVLDIGTRNIRLLRLESAQPGKIRLKNCWSSDSPHELVVSTFIEYPIIDSAPISKAIKTLISFAKVPAPSGIMLLP
ncbi:hypothetical protein HYY75_07830, partial [bacterium]|nr:hypothetical protein [bacterium]